MRIALGMTFVILSELLRRLGEVLSDAGERMLDSKLFGYILCGLTTALIAVIVFSQLVC